jgi:hypothetical protein
MPTCQTSTCGRGSCASSRRADARWCYRSARSPHAT